MITWFKKKKTSRVVFNISSVVCRVDLCYEIFSKINNFEINTIGLCGFAKAFINSLRIRNVKMNSAILIFSLPHSMNNFPSIYMLPV